MALASVPFILPSGKLFAASGNRKVNHVVLCLFAGGIRNLESIQKKEGCLMPFTLGGTEKISNDIIGGMDILPTPSSSPLVNSGDRQHNGQHDVDQAHWLDIEGKP